MTIQYKNKWKPYSLNEDFWREVLEGRTIRELEFDAQGISCMILDNSERVFPHLTGRFMVEVADDQIEPLFSTTRSCDSCEEPILRDPVLLRPLPCECKESAQISQ